MVEIILLVQLVVCCYLSGLVLLVQMSHYPSFHFVAEEEWKSFHSHHSKSISFIVIPLMLLELGLSLTSIWFMSNIYTWIAFVFVVIIWLNTFLQAVPIHGRLSSKKESSLIKKLVQVNIIRTIFWVMRSLLLAWMVWKGIK